MADGGRTHVIPNSINYSDVKPEQIENTVKLIRFTPTANVQQAGPNDVIKFMLYGNGFLDPFSTYIDIEVDIMPELSTFPTKPPTGYTRVGAPGLPPGDQTITTYRLLYYQSHGPNYTRADSECTNPYEPVVFCGKYLDRSAHSFIHRFVARSQGEELERVEEYDVLAGMINDMLYSREQKKIHFNEGFPHSSMGGDHTIGMLGGDGDVYLPVCGRGDQGCSVYVACTDQAYVDDMAENANNAFSMVAPTTYKGKFVVECLSNIASDDTANRAFYDPRSFIQAFDAIYAVNCKLMNPNIGGSATEPVEITDIGFYIKRQANVKRFTIPIYSGIIGVLIPEKKLIPLNLMPLELEFSMNPYALYCMQPAGVPFGFGGHDAYNQLTRNYTITKFEIYGNVIMFEYQVHRALDQVVAQYGLYIPFNTFYLAPQTVNQGSYGSQITAFSQINVYFKSINSVHTVFIYSGYRADAHQRKLHFVSHLLTQLQLRNGTEYTPSERILGDMALEKGTGGGNAFYIETLKSFNKLHDPATDAAFEGCNYFIDNLSSALFFGPKRLSTLQTHQALLGRCQYGISLEGEEMGKDKTTLSGRRGMQPFDLMQVGTKTMDQVSNQLIFVRADMVVFIRQDLVVQLLGR